MPTNSSAVSCGMPERMASTGFVYGFPPSGQHDDHLALCRRLLDAHHAIADSELADGHAKGDRQNYANDLLICPIAAALRRIAALPRSSTYQPFDCYTP